MGKIKIFFIIFISVFLIILLLERNTRKQNDGLFLKPYVDFLWDTTIQKMLKEPLWKERDAYDAGHFLMVPMHYAFISGNKIYKKEFFNFFNNFKQNYRTDGFDELNMLTKLHFLYLVSQYLQLEKTYDGLENDELTGIVNDELNQIWNQPAWQWDRNAFSGGMAERINWKLQNKQIHPSYYRAIIDEELFSFAIAADLKFIFSEKTNEDDSHPYIDGILATAYKVFKEEVVFLDNGSGKWLFQPGAWTDHADYAYSGNDTLEPGLLIKPVSNIAWDTSHSSRFPLWLISLEQGSISANDVEKAQFYKQLQIGLADQFFDKVLLFPSENFSSYRTNNFMDGHNGVYRYGYVTQGKGKGYGPFQLSGTMLLGWWFFLPSNSISIKKVYCDLASRFPLSEEEIVVYLGPDTTRDRNPLIKGRAQFEKGLTELISNLVCQSEMWEKNEI